LILYDIQAFALTLHPIMEQREQTLT